MKFNEHDPMSLDQFRPADWKLASRLMNWKFAEAQEQLHPDVPESVASAVEALSASFGDPGWFGGSFGVVTGLAVQTLLQELADLDRP